MQTRDHRSLFHHDPRWGYWYTRNLRARVMHERGGYYVMTNASGARSGKSFGPKLEGETRVLVLGDSFSAGDGVDNAERYSDRLQSLALRAEVQNLSLPGSGTDQQLLIHEAFAPSLDPDIFVFAPLAENIRRIVAHYSPVGKSENGRILVAPKPYFTLDRGELSLHQVPVPRPLPLEEVPAGAAVNTGGRFAVARQFINTALPSLKTLAFRITRYQPHPEYDEEGSPAFALMAALIRRLFEGSKAKTKVLLPLPYYVHIEGLAAPNYIEPFRGLASALGVEFVDVLPRFLSLPRSLRRACRYAEDIHYTPLAHGIVAEALFGALARRGALQRRAA